MRLLNRFVPALRVNSIYEIDLEELRKQGIEGIITDLDNTLVGAKEPLATPELQEWLKKVKSLGFRIVIVSNNNKARVSRFAEEIDVPFIYSARKPRRKAFFRALK